MRGRKGRASHDPQCQQHFCISVSSSRAGAQLWHCCECCAYQTGRIMGASHASQQVLGSCMGSYRGQRRWCGPLDAAWQGGRQGWWLGAWQWGSKFGLRLHAMSQVEDEHSCDTAASVSHAGMLPTGVQDIAGCQTPKDGGSMNCNCAGEQLSQGAHLPGEVLRRCLIWDQASIWHGRDVAASSPA